MQGMQNENEELHAACAAEKLLAQNVCRRFVQYGVKRLLKRKELKS